MPKVHPRDHRCKFNSIIFHRNSIARTITIIPYAKSFVKLKFILLDYGQSSGALEHIFRKYNTNFNVKDTEKELFPLLKTQFCLKWKEYIISEE